MSSNEEDYNDAESNHDREASQNSKKRRIQRACDVCRRKKIRCDGVQMPGNQCSNCIAYNFECTYVEAAKKRGPPKAYVESLENRLEKMETLLRRLMPEMDLARELGLNGASSSSYNPTPPPPPPRIFPEHQAGCSSSTEVAITAIRQWDATPEFSPPQNEEDREHLELADNLKKLRVDSREYRFFGKSSGAMLVKTAMDLKQEYTGRETNMTRIVIGERRPEFWRPFPWEDPMVEGPTPIYTFPEPDLLVQLVDAYFANLNIYLPLLHRPTFERSLHERLHYRDDAFAAVVLLVCAVGSRYVDDPRVLLDGVDAWHSAGWRYFNQVPVFYCLAVEFLQGSSAPHSCWTMVGIGIRLAQDVGAHRRKPNHILTVEDELWKRAFWCLVCMDRVLSTGLGRPCAIHDEDYDVEFPMECDDEYWEHPDPAQAFKQPPGKPSIISAFNTYIKLNILLSMALRTIYAINKSKILLGFGGEQWQQHIVAELDSALNQWVDSIPDHLRWDPNRENELFFNQSVHLYTHYYLVQILVHRPFISSPKKPSPLSFPSLAICTNAARSASHVMDITAFTAGIVLLLNIWGGKRSGLSTDPNKEMADVHKCMQVLKASEKRWHSAGRIWDILYELASVGELPLPAGSPISNHKRERSADSPIPLPDGSPSLDVPVGSRTIAGSRRVSAATSINADMAKVGPSTPSPASMASFSVGDGTISSSGLATPLDSPSGGMQLFSLPMYSDELGRIPIHGEVNFSMRPPSHVGSNPNPSGPQQPPSIDWFNPPPAPPSHPHADPSGQGMHGLGMNSEFMQSDFYEYSPFAGGGGVPGVPGPSASSSSMGMNGGSSVPSFRNAFPQQQQQQPSMRHSDTHMQAQAHGHGQGRGLDSIGVEGMMGSGRDGVQGSSAGGGGGMADAMMPLSLDNDTFAMWSNTPSGFE
ncbi:hypothetical protein GYMLUDRAFT_239127 [Collybiopsis luxurians FD-317 M1]|nr:hypothetical protein GYMLUDRAFT_239127 [Collybiopsis luxurians FD-317 M1]